MANNNNIQHFTAIDIEKYHNGLLSSKERHDLEKAALDDPFLADALEGYAVAAVNVPLDIAELKKRLGNKVEGAKVIPMNAAAPRNSFKILRAAVMILFVAGASFLIYQFGFNKKQGDIAQVKGTKSEDIKSTDTAVKTTTAPTGTISTPVSDIKTEGPTTGLKTAETPVTVTNKETKSGGNGIDKSIGSVETVTTGKVSPGDVTVTRGTETQPIVSTPSKVADERNESYKTKPSPVEKGDIAKGEANKKLKNNSQELDNDAVKDQVTTQQQNNRNVAASRKVDEQNYYRDKNQATNVFRGRVTDADNNGVPFANVTNVQDNNAGTYTDARGNFNLTYPDTVLNVQVRSIGFENTNVQLRNNVSNNQVVLPDDRKNLSEVVLTNQKPNSAARRDGNMKLEEPEPADGWENYDTYLVNNLNVPDDLKTKQSNSGSAVEVSFEVDKNGEPTNIKVEKSLCAKCDKEAIRLVKEGPKWKRKAKKGRTTVTIYF